MGGWLPADRDCRIVGFFERHFEYQPMASIMASATPFCFCTTQKHLSVKNSNYFNGLGHDLSNTSIRLFYIIIKYTIFITI